MTPETKVETDTPDGFVTYDELKGPRLDAARWSPARLPLPTGEVHIALDPNAELAVGDGEVRVTVPYFSLSDDRFQAADSAKYLILSTRQFELRDHSATFAADLAVANIGGEPGEGGQCCQCWCAARRRSRCRVELHQHDLSADGLTDRADHCIPAGGLQAVGRIRRKRV